MDFESFIGIPYLSRGRDRTGCDCWGLISLAYREQMGIELPSFADEYKDATSLREIARAIEKYIDHGWQKVPIPQPGDGALFAPDVSQLITHVGIYAGEFQGEHKMLHVRRGTDACLESLASEFWRVKFRGFYHYVG